MACNLHTVIEAIDAASAALERISKSAKRLAKALRPRASRKV